MPVGLHGQRMASAIESLADRDTNPSLADAILLDVGPFDALEPDAHAPTQGGLIVKRTIGIIGQAIGGDVWHRGTSRQSDSPDSGSKPTCPTRPSQAQERDRVIPHYALKWI